jgi:hypothetical protein
MAVPTLTAGTLYIDRDRDVRTGEWGPYVKIGIVRDGKTPEQRVKELQTGNPRRVHTIKTYSSPMVESLETRLHHNFATMWVRGEWFEMDENFVNNELDQHIRTYIEEQNQSIEYHRQREELKSTASNETVREPTEVEQELHAKYIEVKVQNDVLKAQSQILKAKLMAEMGQGGGVNGILKLVKRTTPEKTTPAHQKFNRKTFEEKYPELYAQLVVVSQSAPKGSLTMKNVPALNKQDPELRALEKSSKESCEEMKVANIDNETIEPSEALKQLHLEHIELLGEIFNTDLEMERIKSKLAVALGDGEGISDILVWKRVSKTQEKLDSKLVLEQHPEEFESCLDEIPEKTTQQKSNIAIDVEPYREYVL